MNPFPLLGLAAVASGYVVATERLDVSFTGQPDSQIESYAASSDLQIYDMLGHGAEAMNEPHCAPKKDMAATLARDFSESAVESRVTEAGLQMELWGSAPMGTWTLVHQGEDGVTCVVASGTGWTGNGDAGAVFTAALGLPAAQS